MENRRSQLEILRTQKVLDSYIEYNKDKEKFTKYMEELHGKSDKKNNKSGSGKNTRHSEVNKYTRGVRMPGESNERKFKRTIINSTSLEYVQRMIRFYEDMLNDYVEREGEETENKVVITKKMLLKIEERLSDFEAMENNIIRAFKEYSIKA